MIPALNTAADLREAVRLAAQSRRIALGITQVDLAARSGVPFGTLKRFERLGEISLSALLAIADALDAVDSFHALFPIPKTRTLKDVKRHANPPKRVRRRRA